MQSYQSDRESAPFLRSASSCLQMRCHNYRCKGENVMWYLPPWIIQAKWSVMLTETEPGKFVIFCYFLVTRFSAEKSAQTKTLRIHHSATFLQVDATGFEPAASACRPNSRNPVSVRILRHPFWNPTTNPTTSNPDLVEQHYEKEEVYRFHQTRRDPGLFLSRSACHLTQVVWILEGCLIKGITQAWT